MQRRWSASGLLVWAARVAAVVGVAAGIAEPAGAQTFFFSGGEQAYQVAGGVTHVAVTAVGAPGGAGDFGAPGGFGATVSGVLAVTSGQVLFVEVGGPGQSVSGRSQFGGAGGFNGGGGGGGTPTTVVDAGGGGGGASDVRTVSVVQQNSLASRLIVAAGGGGGAGQTQGGGGGNAGSPGHDGPVTGGKQAGGGGAGTLTSGGPAGAGGANGGSQGCPGLPGTGGCGAGQAAAAGGGGGGGLWGGGGGGSDGNDQGGGGGGGGASDITASAQAPSIATDSSGRPSVTIIPNAVCSDASETTAPGGGATTFGLPCSIPPGASATYQIVQAPAHGTLGPVGASGMVTYTPQAGFSGQDSFTFEAVDAAGVSNLATVTVTVPPSAPTCSPVSARSGAGGSAVVSLSCSAPTGTTTTYGIVSLPQHGALSTIDQTTGTVTYTPAAGFSGIDRFIYEASDAGGVSLPATATVTVVPAPRGMPPPPLPRINASMLWDFVSGRGKVRVLSLTVNSVPVGARVEVTCSGRDCPHAFTRVIRARKRCHARRCSSTRAVSIGGPFDRREIGYGGRIVVSVVKRGWIGKVFIFKMRAGIQPEISCLAPNASKPGVGC